MARRKKRIDSATVIKAIVFITVVLVGGVYLSYVQGKIDRLKSESLAHEQLVRECLAYEMGRYHTSKAPRQGEFWRCRAKTIKVRWHPGREA